jgi:hypothetical protein
MEIKEFLEKVIAGKNRRITDDFFLFIQNDRELMKDYLYLVQEHDLQTVNQQIARGIEAEYGLIACGENNEPESKLITTYSLLKKRD